MARISSDEQALGVFDTVPGISWQEFKGESVEIDGFNFEVIKVFPYLGFSINADNNIRLASRSRISLANRCYLRLRKQLSKRALSWRMKIL